MQRLWWSDFSCAHPFISIIHQFILAGADLEVSSWFSGSFAKAEEAVLSASGTVMMSAVLYPFAIDLWVALLIHLAEVLKTTRTTTPRKG